MFFCHFVLFPRLSMSFYCLVFFFIAGLRAVLMWMGLSIGVYGLFLCCAVTILSQVKGRIQCSDMIKPATCCMCLFQVKSLKLSDCCMPYLLFVLLFLKASIKPLVLSLVSLFLMSVHFDSLLYGTSFAYCRRPYGNP